MLERGSMYSQVGGSHMSIFRALSLRTIVHILKNYIFENKNCNSWFSSGGQGETQH